MRDIKIIEWNVNCAAGSKKHGRKELLSIFSEQPACDILILTEFYRLGDYNDFEEKLTEWEYSVFITEPKEGCNDVLLAISKNLCPKLQKPPICKEGMPNFLSVTATTLTGEEFLIAGVRFFSDYSTMKSQFISFLPLANKFDYVIIGGDFNNGAIHGDENKIFTEQEIDVFYNGKLHVDYNYHRIKRWFDDNEILLVTPPLYGFSYPYKKPYKGGSKIDHFAVKGF